MGHSAHQKIDFDLVRLEMVWPVMAGLRVAWPEMARGLGQNKYRLGASNLT